MDIIVIIKHVASLIFFLLCLVSFTRGDVISLNDQNIEDTLKSNELVLVNFYADWCHFSQMLTPIFEDTSKQALTVFPDKGKVALAKVDCDKEVTIAQKYHVTKYPTLKLFRHGEVMKREFRGQRSVEGMIEFLQDQMADRIQSLTSAEDIHFEKDKRYLIGHFYKKGTAAHTTFTQVASQYRDDCTFIILDKYDKNKQEVYAQIGGSDVKTIFNGNLSDSSAMLSWAREQCVPLVRTITFANAEELTEEGLPFLLLFTKKEDDESPKLFEAGVRRELMDLRTSVNILIGDGDQFSHPLHHLGKSVNDLPVLCIDSFRHMFVYPKDTKTGLTTPGQLRNFVLDLQSGKLHREFHNGPDPEPPSPEPAKEEAKEAAKEEGHVPRDGADSRQPRRGDATTPPVSMFRLLQPSSNRYTLLRDEL